MLRWCDGAGVGWGSYSFLGAMESNTVCGPDRPHSDRETFSQSADATKSKVGEWRCETIGLLFTADIRIV